MRFFVTPCIPEPYFCEELFRCRYVPILAAPNPGDATANISTSLIYRGEPASTDLHHYFGRLQCCCVPGAHTWNVLTQCKSSSCQNWRLLANVRNRSLLCFSDCCVESMRHGWMVASSVLNPLTPLHRESLPPRADPEHYSLRVLLQWGSPWAYSSGPAGLTEADIQARGVA